MRPSFKIKLHELTIRLSNTKVTNTLNSSLLHYSSTAVTSVRQASYYNAMPLHVFYQLASLPSVTWHQQPEVSHHGGLHITEIGTYDNTSLPTLLSPSFIRTGQQMVGFATAGAPAYEA